MSNFVYMAPDEHGTSWKHWLEIQHYGNWLRHIGEAHIAFPLGELRLEVWTNKEKQRAREISGRYFSHSPGAPGPNGTVNVAYKYKGKVENFSLSPKEVSDLRDEVLALVSKQLKIQYQVTCGICSASSSGAQIACEHLDYSGIEDMELPFLFVRPLNTEVISNLFVESDVKLGTNFVRDMLLPTLSNGGLDTTKLVSPISEGSVSFDNACRDKDRIRVRSFSVTDAFAGTVREIGIFATTQDGDEYMAFYEFAGQDSKSAP